MDSRSASRASAESGRGVGEGEGSWELSLQGQHPPGLHPRVNEQLLSAGPTHGRKDQPQGRKVLAQTSLARSAPRARLLAKEEALWGLQGRPPGLSYLWELGTSAPSPTGLCGWLAGSQKCLPDSAGQGRQTRWEGPHVTGRGQVRT